MFDVLDFTLGAALGEGEAAFDTASPARRLYRKRSGGSGKFEDSAASDADADLFTATYLGTHVTLTCIGGMAYIDDKCDKVQIGLPANPLQSHFQVMQYAEQRNTGEFTFVSLWNHGFLTATMFGDEHRNQVACLLHTETLLPPVLFKAIVEYGCPLYTERTPEKDCFNYTPFKCAPRDPKDKSKPTIRQVFSMQSSVDKWGMKTSWGTFARALLWDHSISQSDQFFEQEQWVVQRKKK